MRFKDVKALLLNQNFSFKQLTAGFFMGIFYDLINHIQTHHCRFSTCIFIKLEFSLGFFGFVNDEPYLNSSMFFVLFLLNFLVSLLLANVLIYINTVPHVQQETGLCTQ